MKGLKIFGGIIGILVGAFLLLNFLVFKPNRERADQEMRDFTARTQAEQRRQEQEEARYAQEALLRNQQRAQQVNAATPTPPSAPSNAGTGSAQDRCAAHCLATLNTCMARCHDDTCRADCQSATLECSVACGL